MSTSVCSCRDVSQEHGHLTVVGLAESTTPLPRDPDRLAPRLRKPRRIEHENPVRCAQLATDLPREFVSQRTVVPLRSPDQP